MENINTEYATNDVVTRNNKRATKQTDLEWRSYNNNLEFNETLGIARVKGTNYTFRAKIDEKGRLIEYRGNILSDFALDDFDDAELEEEEDFDFESIQEIYKTIDGYDYEVSNVGQIRNVRTGRILKQKIDRFGYCQVCLYKDGVPKWVKVHRLVALAFIPNPKNLPEVNHKDECKTNNRLDNLEWCTSKYNKNYGTRNQRAGKAIAKALSKPVEQLDLSGRVVAKYPSTIEVQRVLGFANGCISEACRNGVKRYGYFWRYKN